MTEITTPPPPAPATAGAAGGLDGAFDAILARVEASALRAAERNADTTVSNNETGAARDAGRSNRS